FLLACFFQSRSPPGVCELLRGIVRYWLLLTPLWRQSFFQSLPSATTAVLVFPWNLSARHCALHHMYTILYVSNRVDSFRTHTLDAKNTFCTPRRKRD